MRVYFSDATVLVSLTCSLLAIFHGINFDKWSTLADGTVVLAKNAAYIPRDLDLSQKTSFLSLVRMDHRALTRSVFCHRCMILNILTCPISSSTVTIPSVYHTPSPVTVLRRAIFTGTHPFHVAAISRISCSLFDRKRFFLIGTLSYGCTTSSNQSLPVSQVSRYRCRAGKAHSLQFVS